MPGRLTTISGLALASLLACGAARAQDVPARAVAVARATTIPACTVFVDAAAPARGTGSVDKPHKTIAAAVSAADDGAIICVAEGTYAESIEPGEKGVTLAGGFQRGAAFKVRDSARYVSHARGKGAGSFIRIVDPGPKGRQLTAIDGFEISGYSQAIVREFYVSQRFDITNNNIHDNVCADEQLAGAGFSLQNVSGRIGGNVFRNNKCGRGGAGALVDATNENAVVIERNHVEANAGTEKDSSHGGAFYFFGKTLTITGNLFVRNTVTQWGAGLFVGAYTAGNQFTTARLSWNVYRDNRAGNSGGGLFCDDGANCRSEHEIFDRNCGGNILLDGGPGDSGPTVARFDQLTNINARAVGCNEPGAAVIINKDNPAPDAYHFVNAIFWGNAAGKDFAVSCSSGCGAMRVNVSYSMLDRRYQKDGDASVSFGDGIVAPVDPLFADAAGGDFHLKSAAGRWTPQGIVKDAATSPLLAKGYPAERTEGTRQAGSRGELGAYGDSSEASRVP